jgi:hypothetical protein
MIHTAYNREGHYASDDTDGSSTEYYATRDALRQALARGTAEFSGGLPAKALEDVPTPATASRTTACAQLDLF